MRVSPEGRSVSMITVLHGNKGALLRSKVDVSRWGRVDIRVWVRVDISGWLRVGRGRFEIGFSRGVGADI